MNVDAGFASSTTSAAAPAVRGAATTSTGLRRMSAYDAAVRELWRPLEMVPESLTALHHEVMRYATLAPSHRNAQPWMMHVLDGELFIHPDFTRRVPGVDVEDESLFMGLGCAAENAGVAARALGLRGDVTFHPAGRGGLKIDLGAAHRIEPSALFHAIPKRHSAPGAYEQRSPCVAELAPLQRCGADLGVDIVLVTDRPRIERLAALLEAAHRIRGADPALRAELKAWTRFTEHEVLQRRDGLFTRCSGAHAAARWLGQSLEDRLLSGPSSGVRAAERARASGGFVVLIGAGREPRHWVQVGRACERVLLHATALNMRTAVINEPIEIRATRLELAAELGSHSRLPGALIRFGYGAAGLASLRRPLGQVMV